MCLFISAEDASAVVGGWVRWWQVLGAAVRTAHRRWLTSCLAIWWLAGRLASQLAR